MRHTTCRNCEYGHYNSPSFMCSRYPEWITIYQPDSHWCGEFKNEDFKGEKMTEKQKDFIETMNEFCKEKFDISRYRTKEEARDYISRNIEEYKLLTANGWALEHGHF